MKIKKYIGFYISLLFTINTLTTETIDNNTLHLSSFLCLYILEGKYLAQELSEGEIQRLQKQKISQKKILTQEILFIKEVLKEIKTVFKTLSKQSSLQKIKEFFSPTQPHYIRHFLEQIKKAENTSDITESSLDTYFYYITFFLLYAAHNQKDIFDYSNFKTFSLIKEHNKKNSLFSLFDKKESMPLKGYPAFDYKEIYNDLTSEPKTTLFTKKALGGIALAIATGAATLYLTKNRFFFNTPENTQKKEQSNQTAKKNIKSTPEAANSSTIIKQKELSSKIDNMIINSGPIETDSSEVIEKLTQNYLDPDFNKNQEFLAEKLTEGIYEEIKNKDGENYALGLMGLLTSYLGIKLDRRISRMSGFVFEKLANEYYKTKNYLKRHNRYNLEMERYKLPGAWKNPFLWAVGFERGKGPLLK
jgi:hypothetical protein